MLTRVQSLTLTLTLEFIYRHLYNTLQYTPKVENALSEKVIKFEFEKNNKNSTRYKEIPEDGMPPVLGSIYVQKWFAGNSKKIEVTIKTEE